jgi:hypothetical protein
LAPFLKRTGKEDAHSERAPGPPPLDVVANEKESPMGTMRWQPAWWNDQYASSWDRVKEAMRRDWEQTKHDLSIKGGHQLNQNVGDTVKQAAGKEAIPPADRANPPKVVGEWSDVELPHQYGFGARDRYGSQHARWSAELEEQLRREWETGNQGARRGWEDVKTDVRRGYEYRR